MNSVAWGLWDDKGHRFSLYLDKTYLTSWHFGHPPMPESQRQKFTEGVLRYFPLVPDKELAIGWLGSKIKEFHVETNGQFLSAP